MLKTLLFVLALMLLLHRVNGQNMHAKTIEKDTNTLRSFLKKGYFYGHARSYFSATINKRDLTDYYAWGLGAGIGYQTPIFLKKFQMGMSGFFLFNIASSDFEKIDPKTGQVNRYEIGLFDIERPNYHQDLDRLEELYLKTFVSKNSIITIGRQIPQTPFINPQDGRMYTTLTEAAVFNTKPSKNITLHGEYIWRISPRSTVRWFNVGESIGVYPVGIDINGKPSQYKNSVKSSGIGVAGLTYQKQQWNLQVWDTFIENILNTSLVKIEYTSKISANKCFIIGGQFIRQHSLGNGGNEDPLKAYTQPQASSIVFSGRIGWQSPTFDWYINTTRIMPQGRYLMPREWGREPFYTFLPRERNEGFGDVTAATVNMFFKPQKHIKIELSGGYFRLPDVKNSTLNKYGMPSYSQINMGVTYQFNHYLKGLSALFLVVRKDDIGETYQNDRFVFNKVNMSHINFIINYNY